MYDVFDVRTSVAVLAVRSHRFEGRQLAAVPLDSDGCIAELSGEKVSQKKDKKPQTW